MAQSQRSSRRQKIEPLDYREMASAPALKGNADATEFFVREIVLPKGEPQLTNSNAETTPAHVSSPGYEKASKEKRPTAVTPITVIKKDQSVSRSGDVSSPGDQGSRRPGLDQDNQAVVPGRGRSQVRRCVLAQDGHSLGEEAIYQLMWRLGKAENVDPNGSRTVRIGSADLGMKINMAKKNVRQNVARLFEKLSIEILEDFDTMNSQARLYRVFSYRQILERRRAVGLEFILRNKGVVFCSADGKDLVKSPAYVTSPGDETFPRPGRVKAKRVSKAAQSFGVLAAACSETAASSTESEDLAKVSNALNRYWAVDEPAAVQLIRSCRRVRPDAKAEEIEFFVQEKVELARTNRNITNPTGLILATVPQCFVGQTFVEFRARLEKQAALEAEEAARKAEESERFRVQITAEIRRLEATVADNSTSEKDRDAAERELRRYADWF